MGRERGREVRRIDRHHEMTIRGRSRIEAPTKEATDAVTETIKSVREEAQESDPAEVSRAGCESSSPSSRGREGNMGCNKR
jgi:hypothetical protein